MVKTTCQHTGIEFEARSKRQRNHPRISVLLNEAHRTGQKVPGAYQAAMDALHTGKEQGLKSIDEFIVLAQDAIESRREELHRSHTEQRAVARQRREKIHARNARLTSHGYRWRRRAVGTEESWAPGGCDAGVGEVDYYEWELVTPAGEVITEEAALCQISQGDPR